MKKLSADYRRSLREATLQYSAALPGSPAEEYLRTRGLEFNGIERYALGYVDDPMPGHESYQGMLTIPYLRPGDCCSIRFRCIEDHDHAGHGKYNTTPGDKPWLYNTAALGGDWVGIAEGEFDAITASRVVPTVGVPGVSSWQPSWDRLFEGYQRILVFVDGDEPGRKFARELSVRLDNVRRIVFTQDVTELVEREGIEALERKIE